METAVKPVPASPFRLAVEKESAQHISRCYQCGKCTAGCPVSYRMDLGPRRVMRALQLGLVDEVLRSNTIWLCVQCQMCSGRCPREIDIARVMEACRLLWHRQKGIPPGDRDVYLFHKLFVDSTSVWGRLWEPQLAGFYNLLSRHFLANLELVPGMLARGKLNIIPERAAMSDLSRMKKRLRAYNQQQGLQTVAGVAAVNSDAPEGEAVSAP
jgi:heterodisulfide reductase subunit C